MVIIIELNKRQEHIIQIVKITVHIGESIAIGSTRATLRPDLAILTMAGYLEARPRVIFIRVKLGLLSEAVKKIKVQDYQSRPVVIDKMFPYTMQFVRCFRGRWYIVRCIR